jgi:chromosome segregation ATPase
VTQTDIDIQLKVWKDLAISKQILMGAATEALGLDAECSTDELRSALDRAIQRAKNADVNIAKIREEAGAELAEMKALVESSQKAKEEADELAAESIKARETAERQLAIGKSENTEALKKARADVADKQNKLKAISKSLADTPENVVKKLKTLKKQKMDEAKLRTQTESKLQSTRKEKKKLEAELETQKALAEKAIPLAEQVRELHGLCKEANKKIKSLSEDKKDQIKIPKLDKELLESFEPADEK